MIFALDGAKTNCRYTDHGKNVEVQWDDPQNPGLHELLLNNDGIRYDISEYEANMAMLRSGPSIGKERSDDGKLPRVRFYYE